MADYYVIIKHLHMLTVLITLVLFVLRFIWQCRGSRLMQQRWVRTVPHVNDTILLISGICLVSITHFYPFSPQGHWLTEKLFGVIIYILLGSVTFSRRPHSVMVRSLSFIAALVAFGMIVWLATTKTPLLEGL